MSPPRTSAEAMCLFHPLDVTGHMPRSTDLALTALALAADLEGILWRREGPDRSLFDQLARNLRERFIEPLATLNRLAPRQRALLRRALIDICATRIAGCPSPRPFATSTHLARHIVDVSRRHFSDRARDLGLLERLAVYRGVLADHALTCGEQRTLAATREQLLRSELRHHSSHERFQWLGSLIWPWGSPLLELDPSSIMIGSDPADGYGYYRSQHFGGGTGLVCVYRPGDDGRISDIVDLIDVLGRQDAALVFQVSVSPWEVAFEHTSHNIRGGAHPSALSLGDFVDPTRLFLEERKVWALGSQTFERIDHFFLERMRSSHDGVTSTQPIEKPALSRKAPSSEAMRGPWARKASNATQHILGRRIARRVVEGAIGVKRAHEQLRSALDFILGMIERDTGSGGGIGVALPSWAMEALKTRLYCWYQMPTLPLRVPDSEVIMFRHGRVRGWAATPKGWQYMLEREHLAAPSSLVVVRVGRSLRESYCKRPRPEVVIVERLDQFSADGTTHRGVFPISKPLQEKAFAACVDRRTSVGVLVQGAITQEMHGFLTEHVAHDPNDHRVYEGWAPQIETLMLCGLVDSDPGDDAEGVVQWRRGVHPAIEAFLFLAGQVPPGPTCSEQAPGGRAKLRRIQEWVIAHVGYDNSRRELLLRKIAREWSSALPRKDADALQLLSDLETMYRTEVDDSGPRVLSFWLEALIEQSQHRDVEEPTRFLEWLNARGDGSRAR